MRCRLWLALAATLVLAPAAVAQTSLSSAAGFTPRVPVSGLARPSLAIDPSRLQISTSFTFGSYGRNVAGLQVTSFQYQFRQPLAMSLRVGNAWGAGGFNRGSAFFLEGLDLVYQPSGSFLLHVGYQDLRSPLQRGFQTDPYGPFGGPWGR